jgi:hypothetical protein
MGFGERAKTHCNHFFEGLSLQDRETLLGYLSEFGSQLFIKMKMAVPDLLTRVLSSEAVYLYWVNSAFCA